MEVQAVEVQPNVLLRVLNATWLFLVVVGVCLLVSAGQRWGMHGSVDEVWAQIDMRHALGIGTFVVAGLFALLALVVQQSLPPRADRHPDLEGSS
jgi:drug/metabolite transporter (DMT)-like permease